MATIKPHGGRLVNRVSKIEEDEVKGLEQASLDYRSALDLELIGVGAYSPLEGFMTSDDYNYVLEKMCLSNYIPWPMPITLAVTSDKARQLKDGDDIALVHGGDKEKFLGILHLEEKFPLDKKNEAELVYKTKDPAHPGVKYLLGLGDVLLGGKIDLVRRIKYRDFLDYRFDPADTRRIFAERGWRTVIGFQTRNPIHRAHEYIQKCALEMVDGLFIHPLVGATKNDDVPAETRMRCYEEVIRHYYPKNRVLLGVFPTAMRYAGPREAIFHALVRKNYGCTHFTVGRDHAGVGNYYGPFEAQDIFYEFEACEIGIVPLFFDHVFYCRRCGHMASLKTCPHGKEDRVSLSGTKVREFLEKKQILPEEFARPEVSRILIEANGGDSCQDIKEEDEVKEEI
ncbi:MAG: sulfate adenylyltransferase [Candidatus Hydrothermarchaeales archaeon]